MPRDGETFVGTVLEVVVRIDRTPQTSPHMVCYVVRVNAKYKDYSSHGVRQVRD